MPDLYEVYKGDGGMKLEDCTKEELIYLMRKKHCYTFERPEQLEIDVLLYRSARCTKSEAYNQEQSGQAFKRYVSIMAPYNGKRIADIPDRVFKKARAALNEHEKYEKAWHRDNARWNKIQARLNELLCNKD